MKRRRPKPPLQLPDGWAMKVTPAGLIEITVTGPAVTGEVEFTNGVATTAITRTLSDHESAQIAAGVIALRIQAALAGASK